MRASVAAQSKPSAGRGFTLIELMVVVAIVGILLGTIIAPLVAQLQIREIRESESALERVREALVGFAQANGRLPCPDTDAVPDGVEDGCPGGTGTAVLAGVLPWQTLGLGPHDRWGRFYRYAVSRELTNPAVPGAAAAPAQVDLTDAGALTVLGDRGNTKAALTVTTTAAAVVVSTGSNGNCGIRLNASSSAIETLAPPDDGARWGCAALNGAGAADEFENVNGDATFVSRPRSEGGGGCDDAPASNGPLCAFDDQLTWVPTTILLGKLIEAGQLP